MKLSTLAVAAGMAGAVLWTGARGWAAEPAARPADTRESGEILPDPAKISPDGQRFLLIVETSADNRKWEEANRQAVFDLIVNGIHGQMRTGDTFGIWTFSDTVRAGDFPMTIWDADRSLEIASQAAAFLQNRKYAKSPSLQPLVGELRRLADRVGDVDVLIISSGRTRIVGTPFDQNINAAYDAYAKRPAKLARLPVVTGFVVRKGRPIRASVVLAGDRIVLPERPPPIAKSAASPPGQTNAPSATAVAKSSAAAPAPPLKKVMQIVTRSNTPSPSMASTAAPAATASGTPIPANPASSTVEKAGPARLAPESGQAAAADPSVAPVDLANPSTNATGAVAGNLTPAALAPTPAELTSLPPVESGFSVMSVSSILSAAADAIAGPPLRVAAREPEPAVAPSPDPAPATTSTSLPVAPVGAAMPVPVPDRLGAGTMLAIGGVLLGAVAFLFIVALRRLPRPARGSLITQSMHRE